jgi:topoisomerase-4 subunit B
MRSAPTPPPSADDYGAHHIEILEGLEPVRRRPGMFIGGTDERAMHHLVAELLDNAADEAMAGFAGRIEVGLAAGNRVTVGDNGRGIPVGRHPRRPDKTALEVALTMLHAGGKFDGRAYATAGGLHGVGLSVVNALSDELEVEVARDRALWSQRYVRGHPLEPLQDRGAVAGRRGTRIAFHPDPQIFGAEARFRPAELYRMARTKALLLPGVEIRWRCEPSLIAADDATPAAEVLRFPGGVADFLDLALAGRERIDGATFTGAAPLENGAGRLEWAVTWLADDDDGFITSFCNTVPTPGGGSHESGLRTALTRGVKTCAERFASRDGARMTADDVVGGAAAVLSIFLAEPQFQGQTKERLTSPDAQRLVEGVVRDHLDHWLSEAPERARGLVSAIAARTDDRIRRQEARKARRKAPQRRLRLPGKLAECGRSARDGTELFVVEGDSAGGSAKAARDRETQAVLPLRGKILNVASAADGRLGTNRELQDLIETLGCASGRSFALDGLRYDKIIIMTDADVDGAHIAALLMTFFYREMPELVALGHLYLAQPPLYRLTAGGVTRYARDDDDRERLLSDAFPARAQVEISRFKGLGEMPAAQLKATTMDPATRTLLRVRLPNGDTGDDHASATARLVEALMGRRPEPRFLFIQEHARFVPDVDV